MFQKYIAGQYRRPSGIVGRWIGQRMAEQHQPENLWTVNLLDVQPDDHILEVGFGSGFAIQHVAERLTTGVIIGVDFSRTMVRSARRRNAQAVRAGKVDLRYGDAAQLPLDDHAFDKVYSIHSLYFWMQPLQALQEIMRVLKPGGMFILTLLPTERWGAPEDVPSPTPTFRPYSQNELKALLSQVGFIHLRVEADPNLEHRSNYSMIGYKSGSSTP
jgi:ubiquinone/menaquinone biosynthesis C-methylase UbiE